MEKYKRVDLDELSEDLPKDELIKLYSEHTGAYICSKFSLTKHELSKLLDFYQIKKHTPEESTMLSWSENPNQGTKNSHYYNNGEIQIRVKEGDIVPDGFEPGALKFTNDQTETMLQKRGYRSPMQTEIGKENFKKSMLDKYGVDNPMKLKDVFLKVNKGNNSKEEDNYYNYLVNKYGKDNVIRNYKEARYPYFCDFYIPSEDLFIEYQGHWTHGNKPFDKNDPNDIEISKMLEERSKTSKYFKTALDVWTRLDVQKRETAKRNNLNYIEIFK